MRTVQITVMSTSIVRVRAVVDMCALLFSRAPYYSHLKGGLHRGPFPHDG